MDEDIGEKPTDILEHCASLLDRAHDAGEIVVHQHHVGRLFRHVGAGDPHGDSDMGALERRRVVDPVSGHGDDVFLLDQRLHDAHLLIRAHPGEDDLGLVERELKADGRKSAQLIAGDHVWPF